MLDLALNALVSILTGLALWAFLPRGVVLTRTPAEPWPDGSPRYNTWIVRNESAVPVRLLRVYYSGISTFDSETGVINEVDLPSWVPQDEELNMGISLSFDDEVLELSRDAEESPWKNQRVPPGDALIAMVNLNRTLVIQYRRDGWSGVFERRAVRIDGGV